MQLESETNSNIKELTPEVRDLITQMKKVEADVALVKNVNEKLCYQLIETDRQCWASAQHSRRECLEVVGIPIPILNDLLEGNVSKVFHKLGVYVKGKDIQECHRLKDNKQGYCKIQQ